jgi:glucose/arabinose dehydrogenase
MGLERPFDVQFGPDDAMYIVDYGQVEIDMPQTPPYVYNEKSGIIWRVTRGEKKVNKQ